MKELLKYYCDYNIWANQKLADFFSDKPEEFLSQHIENSFPSIKKTVLHIWSAETGWLARMREDNRKNKPITDETASTNTIFKRLVQTSKDFSAFVNQQSAEYFQTPVPYNTWDGTSWEMSPQLMVHHCMNHSTYHRGQLVTLARQLGWKEGVPSTDLLYYSREN